MKSEPVAAALPSTLSAEGAPVAAAQAAAAAPAGFASPVARTRLHQRALRLEGFRRDDGLWDIEGHLVDVKDHDFDSGRGLRPAGAPIHDMWLRITVDRTLTIVDAQAKMAARPYPGHCEAIEPDYRRLVGLRIAPGFTNAVRSRLGARDGCAHLTEMVSSLATTAFQTLASERHHLPRDVKPPHLDRCHALDTRGPVVREHYPRWYQPDEPVAAPPGIDAP